MSQKIWNALAMWAFAIILFICTLVAVRWMVDFVTWTSLDSGWAQVVGSLAALGVAIFVMSRQNKNAAKLIFEADRIATLKRAKSVHSVLTRSRVQLNNIRDCTLTTPQSAEEIAKVSKRLGVAAAILNDMTPLLGTIPIYDLGNFDLAEGVHQFTELVPNYLRLINILQKRPGDAGTAEVITAEERIHELLDEAVEIFEQGMGELRRSS